MSFLADKTVLVTGGCGTVGRELTHQILKQQPHEIRVLDCNESEIFFLEQELAAAAEKETRRTRTSCYVGDVRDVDKLMMLCDGCDVLYHVAALKHVILCERSPFDAVQTNVLGVKNVINAALAHKVERAIFTSSDKAVNPTNVMGTSKLLGERLFTAANNLQCRRGTIFSSTRFGNVLGSRGSVLPIFYRQIREGGPVTLTDSRMTRFVMTLQDSCRLVLSAGEKARGGEVFVTKMPIMRIEDLAEVMVDELAPWFGHDPSSIEIQEVGAKAGEKLFEELMTDEETRRTAELQEMFAVLPAFRAVYEDIAYDYPDATGNPVTEPYASSVHKPMNRFEIHQYLRQHGILETLKATEGGAAQPTASQLDGCTPATKRHVA